MLQRFASAALVAVVAVAIAVSILLIVPGITIRQAAPVLMLWSLAPCVWGLWAMVAPKRLVPGRLPVWGALLGIIAASLAIFVLNLPKRVFGMEFDFGLRLLAVLVLGSFYYVMWTMVAAAYRKLVSLAGSTPVRSTTKAA